MSFSLGKTRLRIHPLLPLLWGAALLLGSGWSLAAAMSALLIHEAGHAIAARGLGIAIRSFEITPFGGVMILENSDSVSAPKHFLAAAAGPGFSLLGCFAAAWLLRRGVPFDFAQRFARMNFLLFAVNLLPGLPLDGGEMLLALLTIRFSRAAVIRVLTGIGSVIGVSLCAISLLAAFQGEYMLFPLFAGLYLLYAVHARRRDSTAAYVTSLIARRQRLERRGVLPVEFLAVGVQTPALSILPGLSLGKYHVIRVLSRDGMACVGQLEEQAFCEMLLENPEKSLGEWLGETKKTGDPG